MGKKRNSNFGNPPLTTPIKKVKIVDIHPNTSINSKDIGNNKFISPRNTTTYQLFPVNNS